MGPKNIPKRWDNYSPFGNPVFGTRFLPFKVPLKLEVQLSRQESERFTIMSLLDAYRNLEAVIDLTNTNRYYDPKEFTSRGVQYRKINLVGQGKLPTQAQMTQFFRVVDQLMDEMGHDSDALIGVHCTHGLNRTGYLICQYMVTRMKIDPQEAIDKFQTARGHTIERHQYVDALKEDYNRGQYQEPIQKNNFHGPTSTRRLGRRNRGPHFRPNSNPISENRGPIIREPHFKPFSIARSDNRRPVLRDPQYAPHFLKPTSEIGAPITREHQYGPYFVKAATPEIMGPIRGPESAPCPASEIGRPVRESESMAYSNPTSEIGRPIREPESTPNPVHGWGFSLNNRYRQGMTAVKSDFDYWRAASSDGPRYFQGSRNRRGRR